MVARRINNLLVVVIILCSTSLFNLKGLGKAEKAIELLGIGIIAGLLALHIIYARQERIKHQFNLFIALIFLSMITSLFMAGYDRDQTFSATLFAERAIFYYLFYYLLHQLKIRPRDLEWIIIGFGILHGLLFLVQYAAYPTILFNTFINISRGTIRIYLAGSDYLAICFFMSIMAFLRTNKPRYLLFMLMSFSIFVLLGGRQTMALMAFILVLAVFLSRKVKSRVGITIMIAGGIFLIFILFQPIIKEMLLESRSNTVQGESYIRIRAAKYFLTDFYKSMAAYIMGNGSPASDSAYGGEVNLLKVSRGYFLGDIGIIGSYIMYGMFFLVGVLGMIFKVLLNKLEDKYLYIKYVFYGFLLSLLTGAGFTSADFICSLCCLLYIVDVSRHVSTSEENQQN
jgi:hypothetical protein